MSRPQANSHVHQDNSVVERRLRPIYDWLDSGNNKKALQECDKVLKKTPNLQCAKALKALSLHRVGKENECNVILDVLTKEVPCDDSTLQAMALCYREMQELEKICKLYETVVKNNPNNEELHTHLFMSYVRISDFKSQQQTAMALYKSKPKNPYYCWAIMSVILQATRGEGSKDPQKRHLLLSLAERMFNKLLNDNKVDAEQEVQLYIIILNLLGKYEDILDVLNGPLGTKLQCTNIPQSKLEYLTKLNRWIEVNLICKGLLIYSVDRWDIWKEYINSVFELMSAPPRPETIGEDVDVPDDTPEKAHEFICGIIESGTENDYLLRGPYLARFELCSKLHEKNMNFTEILGDLTELFIEYFRKFGHKQCCVTDLRLYLNLLESEQKMELASRLIKDVGISSTSVPQTELQMQRHICALQLSRLCGSHRNLSSDHLKALITALYLHYQHGYQTYGKNLLPTDLGPSDPYALMAAHVLYDLAHMEKSSNCIVVALMLLESLLKNSHSNFHAKLLAIRLYHDLGGGTSAHEMYNNLDVKHLQLDSLGFIHCAQLPTTGLFTLCTNLFDTTLKFFSSNYKDSSDHLTFSYKFGSFMKIDELMDFRERMNNSLHYTTIAVDRIMLNLVECMSLETLYSITISPKDDNINWELLTDNHDLSVYITWDPERINDPPEDWPQTKSLFEQNVRFLKLRSSILFATANAIEIVNSLDGTRQEHVKALRKLLDDWKILYERTLTDNFVPIQQNLLPLPLPSRLHGALAAPYFTVFNSFFELFLSLTSDDIELIEKCTKCTVDELSKLTEILRENTLKKSNDFLDKRKSMEIAVNCVEIISISSVICVLCSELIKPLQIKKGKKKSADPKGTEHLQRISEKLKSEMNIFCDILQDWIDVTPVEEFDTKFENLNLKLNENIVDKIRHSYTIANKEMQLILKTKIKLLT